MQTGYGSSETLIGWKSIITTYVPNGESVTMNSGLFSLTGRFSLGGKRKGVLAQSFTHWWRQSSSLSVSAAKNLQVRARDHTSKGSKRAIILRLTSSGRLNTLVVAAVEAASAGGWRKESMVNKLSIYCVLAVKLKQVFCRMAVLSVSTLSSMFIFYLYKRFSFILP